MTPTERGCLFYVLRLFALVVAALFILVSVATLVAFNLERQVFNPEVYKASLENQGFYDHAPELIGADLAYSGPSGDDAIDALKSLSLSDMRAILVAILPADWLKQQTESALDQAAAMLDTDAPPEVVISLATVKQRMAGPEGVAALGRLVASWPDCAADQLVQALSVISSSGSLSALPACNPPEQLRPTLDPLLAEAAQTIADAIPASINLVDMAPPGAVQAARPAIRLARQIIHLSPILPVLLLLLITAFAVRQPKDLNAWWGIPLLLVGIIGIVIAVALSPLRLLATEELSIQLSLAPGGLREVANGVLQTISQRAGLVIGAESVLVGLAGFMCLVFGFTIWRKDQAVPGA